MPSNKNQLSKELGIDYKGIQHHIKVLEENNLVIKTGNPYGVMYCVSALFENNEIVFEEIVDKLNSGKSSLNKKNQSGSYRI